MLSENLKKAAANNQELLAMRPLPKETLKSLREFYRVGLTYSSNALEGNSLTETETKVVIEDGLTVNGKPLRDVYEAVGHAKAYDHIHELAKRKTLEESDILKLHQLFYQQIDPENAGKYRSVPVFISGSHYTVTQHQKIAAEMKKFVSWFNKNEQKLHPVEFAAEVHKRFVFIHPFVDGNGRMARLLMNLALLRGEYTIALIPAIRRIEYVGALEAAHANENVFVDFVADCVVATQMDLLRLLKNSGGVNATGGKKQKKNGGVNLHEKILAEIQKNPGVNAPALSSKLELALRTTQRYLKSLIDDEKIEFRGAPKNGGYFAK
ncbi:Fic family protein [Fibrobacter sp. UWEL]|uniref:Fic family protein n=1 Tax=Fibrobacter sp. UWEL TaxID=1896209 RepID=UPI00091BA7FF|nr:Fic family protein [Fibrobacter sp. UWEL]SHL22572.1 Winged helix-turn-helix DNA-binding [Fibrobacter sp. UWEL]